MNRCLQSVVLAACVALAGCSSSGGTIDAGGGALTFTQFCDKYVDTLVGQASNCLGGPKDLWKNQVNVNCVNQGKAVTAMRATYDPATAQACINAAAGISCADALSGTASLPDCNKTVAGKVAIGSTCYADIDCGEKNWCSIPTGTCMGSCKAQIVAGAACAMGDECINGYSCVNGTCTINPASGTADVGASCTGSVRCKLGLVCNAVTKNCATPVKEGQACVFGHQVCELFTACSSGGTCVRYPGAGANCGATTVADGGSAYEYVACLSSYCKTAPASAAGTCTVLLAENATCSTGAECLSGTCTATKCTAACTIP